ncbi:EAL domain-containing protein [Sulfurimonas sp.]
MDDISCENLNKTTLDEINITPKEYENILNIQASILQKIALNHDYDDTLQHLCLLTEQLLPNAVASIMTFNKKTNLMNVLAAPSIPPSAIKALSNLRPGPKAGSCGNAIFHEKPQYILNTFTDDKWIDLKNIAYDFNLCSCWSMPIKNEENVVIGTFALSSFEHRLPTLFHKRLLETAAFIVNIVLKNKKVEEKIQYMLYYDALTGLHNKRYLDEILDTHEENTLLLLDINNFSYVNNTYGYEIGNKLLKAVAEIFQYNLHCKNICRLESDKFAIVLQENKNLKDEISKFKHFIYSYEIIIDGITLNTSFTYGAALGKENLFINAVIALKEAKRNGKSSLHIFNSDEEYFAYDKRKSFIEANNLLHYALQHDEIVPYFQGIRNNKTGKIVKFEALARIKHNKNVISPYSFIEPARLSGLLPEITKVMIDKSFRVMSKNDYTFSINLTEDDLIRHYIQKYLQEKSKEYNINPSRVILEILEGVSATGKKNHIKQLSALKDDGYAIAIDDFGTEYSNFERVLDLEIDYLKIDAKYIKDIDTNEKSYEITKAIVFFAKNAKIPCIAEFVHNKEVQKIMEKLEIEFSQGYYFSQPNEIPISL